MNNNIIIIILLFIYLFLGFLVFVYLKIHSTSSQTYLNNDCINYYDTNKK